MADTLQMTISTAMYKLLIYISLKTKRSPIENKSAFTDQSASHYLKKLWPTLQTRICVARPWWVYSIALQSYNLFCTIHLHIWYRVISAWLFGTKVIYPTFVTYALFTELMVRHTSWLYEFGNSVSVSVNAQRCCRRGWIPTSRLH